MKIKIITIISRFLRGRDTRYQCSKKLADSGDNFPETEEFERCVMCGAVTCVPVSMPVDWREDYEIGIGQLCIECKRKL